jgi:hypothetical protein
MYLFILITHQCIHFDDLFTKQTVKTILLLIQKMVWAYQLLMLKLTCSVSHYTNKFKPSSHVRLCYYNCNSWIYDGKLLFLVIQILKIGHTSWWTRLLRRQLMTYTITSTPQSYYWAIDSIFNKLPLFMRQWEEEKAVLYLVEVPPP